MRSFTGSACAAPAVAVTMATAHADKTPHRASFAAFSIAIFQLSYGFPALSSLHRSPLDSRSLRRPRQTSPQSPPSQFVASGSDGGLCFGKQAIGGRNVWGGASQ